MARFSADGTWWQLRLFPLALLVTCCGGKWLNPGRKDDPDSTLISFQSSYRACAPKTARCWCGSDEDRHVTIINVKQCPFSTSWGTQCEPCEAPDMSCRKLTHCTRCMRDNPQAICAACPSDRRGLHCEEEFPCQMPNITEQMTVKARFTRKGVYKLEFSCTGGRVRQGPRTIKCQSKRKPTPGWNRPPPKCVLPMLCSTVPPATIPFTRVKSRNQEHVLYECDQGYLPSGNILQTALQCDNGIWVQTGPSVKCEQSPKCTTLPTYLGAGPVDGVSIKSIYHAGQHVLYECKAGFEPPDTSYPYFNLTCADQRWEGRIPECVLKGCPKLTVYDGDVTYKGRPEGDGGTGFVPLNAVATISCRKGFVVQGSPETTCSSSGKWEPFVPMCVTKACEHGTMCALNATLGNNVIYLTDKTEIYPGQTVTFGCEKGSYRKANVGNIERTCLYNGTLSGAEIICKRVPTCQVDTTKDPHLRFCRMNGNEPCIPGRDNYKGNNFDIPENTVPLGGSLRFACSDSTDPDDSEKSHYYQLVGEPQQDCLGHFATPSCVPVCGKQRVGKVGLIRGGTKSEIEEWPWQAALLQRDSPGVWGWVCGATLVYDRWAITAAHCVTEFRSMKYLNPTDLKLVFGKSTSTSITSSDIHQDEYNVKNTFYHPDYDMHTFDADIALLELETPVQMGQNVGPACLPMSLECSDEQVVVGKRGWVTGWGQTSTGQVSDALREVPLLVADKADCEAHAHKKGYLQADLWTDNMFCAQSESPTQDTTSGDSGGPFVMRGEDTDEWVLEGVISWGVEKYQHDTNISCAVDAEASTTTTTNTTTTTSSDDDDAAATATTADPNASNPSQGAGLRHACFSGYTRVANFLDWIETTTGMKATTSADGGCGHEYVPRGTSAYNF